jgi:hypothetical protein
VEWMYFEVGRSREVGKALVGGSVSSASGCVLGESIFLLETHRKCISPSYRAIGYCAISISIG